MTGRPGQIRPLSKEKEKEGNIWQRKVEGEKEENLNKKRDNKQNFLLHTRPHL